MDLHFFRLFVVRDDGSLFTAVVVEVNFAETGTDVRQEDSDSLFVFATVALVLAAVMRRGAGDGRAVLIGVAAVAVKVGAVAVVIEKLTELESCGVSFEEVRGQTVLPIHSDCVWTS